MVKSMHEGTKDNVAIASWNLSQFIDENIRRSRKAKGVKKRKIEDQIKGQMLGKKPI